MASSFRYNENPLVFVNSTDSSIPQGRNVRAQARTQQAAQQAPVRRQEGSFALLDFNLKRHSGKQDSKCGQKRRKKTSQSSGSSSPNSQCDVVAKPGPHLTNFTNPLQAIQLVPRSSPNPSEVLAVATFHIRRLAAMTVQTHPDRLTEVLRCRQWSCVSIALDRFGQSRCLDSALFCVASKLGEITGNRSLPFATLSNYETALQNLQAALQDPTRHDHHDLMTSTQLLAIYEMLDSLENTAWTKHVAGAESLSNRPSNLSLAKPGNARSFAETAPMFTDALLSGNDYFFSYFDWRSPLEAAIKDSPIEQNARPLLSCLLEVPQLLIEINIARRNSWDIHPAVSYSLLDRAHTLRDKMRIGLMGSNLYSQSEYDALGSFDKLGLCLAALVALDRLIEALRPVGTRSREMAEDQTGQLCAQLLQLELGTGDAYPASDVMSAFHFSNFGKQGSFVIALPGPQG